MPEIALFGDLVVVRGLAPSPTPGCASGRKSFCLFVCISVCLFVCVCVCLFVCSMEEDVALHVTMEEDVALHVI